MTYRGVVKNGVVVLERPMSLREGTTVLVEPEQVEQPQKGTGAAILAALRDGGAFVGDPEEWDRQLAELKESKWAEVREQMKQEPETL